MMRSYWITSSLTLLIVLALLKPLVENMMGEVRSAIRLLSYLMTVLNWIPREGGVLI